MWEPHFRPEERLEDIELEQQTMEFLFADSDLCTFMNSRTFEQVELPRIMLGPADQFLQSGMMVPIEFFEGKPISVVTPDVVETRVATTAPATHAQQDSAWKEATLENGVEIRVPLFIGPGETVRVDVRTGHYVERARSDRKRIA
jgi:elongation factor P